MEKTPLERAVDLLGNQTALADAIGDGVKQQNISYWLKTGRVPSERCAGIERATDWRVHKHELRPDVFDPPPEKVAADRSPA